MPQAGLVGDMRISYAKFLQLLRGNRIKRLIIYGDLRTAIVEVSQGSARSKGGGSAIMSGLGTNFLHISFLYRLTQSARG